MRIISLVAVPLCLINAVGAECGENETELLELKIAAPLVTSNVSAKEAAFRGTEVVRAVAASEPVITSRHAAHLSTIMGEIKGGGMVFGASCRQKFKVEQVLGGAGRLGEREISYSYIESVRGFPLPQPTRPVANGEKVFLVLGFDGSLVKVLPETDDNRKEIEAIVKSIKLKKGLLVPP